MGRLLIPFLLIPSLKKTPGKSCPSRRLTRTCPSFRARSSTPAELDSQSAVLDERDFRFTFPAE